MASYPIIEISRNMDFEKDPSFGEFDPRVIFDLLCSIDLNFSEALEIEPFTTDKCVISFNHLKDIPQCCKESEDLHHIYLHVYRNYWSKWIYQFAHEYCHHLIGGEFTGEVTGLKWFEETVCELSSMYHLHLAVVQWHYYKSEDMFPHFYLQHQGYLQNLLNQNPELIRETNRLDFLSSWSSILNENKYHRAHYNAIAVRMFPLFVENPHLWKIILHFGDTRKWSSLDELFQYLRSKATSDYASSLLQLQNLLCPWL